MSVRRVANVLVFFASAFLWVTLVVRFVKTCFTSAEIERRRIEEAKMLLELVCSNAKGASLAREFARCEDAHVLVRSTTISVLRIVENTLDAMLFDLGRTAKKGGLALIQIGATALLLMHAPGYVFMRQGGSSFGTTAKEVAYSPLAAARMHQKITMFEKME